MDENAITIGRRVPRVPPAEDPENPYARRDGMAPMERIPTYDDDAAGLDVDAIDSLLKASFTDGVHVGRNRGASEMRERFPQIFDEGYAKGRRVQHDVAATFASDLTSRLRGVEAMLKERRDRTPKRNVSVRLTFEFHIGVVAALINSLIAEYALDEKPVSLG